MAKAIHSMIRVLEEARSVAFYDQAFGLNTQKSGLVDTMWDLIVNCAGAGIGAAAGFAHLKGWKGGPLAAELRAFARQNPKLFHDDAERDA